MRLPLAEDDAGFGLHECLSALNEVKAEGMSGSCAISPLLSFSIAAWETAAQIGADSPNTRSFHQTARTRFTQNITLCDLRQALPRQSGIQREPDRIARGDGSLK